MRNLIIACFLVAALSSWAYAVKPKLPRDYEGQKIQDFAPDGSQARTLTVNSTTVDMHNNVKYAVFALQSSAKFRLQSTVTKVGTLRYLPKGNVYQRAVNDKTAFISISSATNTVLELQ